MIFVVFCLSFYGAYLECVLQSYVKKNMDSVMISIFQASWTFTPTRPTPPMTFLLHHWQDLSDEMQNSYGVKPGRFRQLFNQTLQQQLGPPLLHFDDVFRTEVTFLKECGFGLLVLPNLVWSQLVYWQ